MTSVRTRYAPSPTGNLHVGGAWTAFFNWLFARSQSGTFILRIEDTDRSRSTEEYERAILEDFRWLGIDRDEGPDVGGPYGPYRQTERASLYRQYAQELLARGAGYYCYCTPEELDAERRQAQTERRPYRYSGRCRSLSDEDRVRFVAEGRQPTIRLRIADYGETIVVDDLVQRRVEFDPTHLDDYIIVRSDGSPLYNFANVVDDHLMAITHIIRGAEHLSNTPKQWVMYRALGWMPPQVAHLPLILGPDRKKLSKRHGDTSVGQYRQEGFLPEALLNFFALMGWYPEQDRELYSLDELIARFRIRDLGKASPIFDLAKLTWLNSIYMRDLIKRDPQRVVDVCLEALRVARLVDGQVTADVRAYVAQVIQVLGDRLKTGRDILTYGDFFFADGVSYDRAAEQQYFSDPQAATILTHLRDRIATSQPFDRDTVEQVIRRLAEDLGVHSRQIIHPTRVALTGKTAGPGLFELIALLGKDRVLRRLDAAVSYIRRTAPS